jgi:hypothetical protein
VREAEFKTYYGIARAMGSITRPMSCAILCAIKCAIRMQMRFRVRHGMGTVYTSCPILCAMFCPILCLHYALYCGSYS